MVGWISEFFINKFNRMKYYFIFSIRIIFPNKIYIGEYNIYRDRSFKFFLTLVIILKQ